MGMIPSSDLESVRGRGRSVRPLRGRENQIKHIEIALRNATDTRRGKVLLMEGVSGAGKTSLLIEAIGMAISNDFSVVKSVSGMPGPGNLLVFNLVSSLFSSPGTAPSKGCPVPVRCPAWLSAAARAALSRLGPAVVARAIAAGSVARSWMALRGRVTASR